MFIVEKQLIVDQSTEIRLHLTFPYYYPILLKIQSISIYKAWKIFKKIYLFIFTANFWLYNTQIYIPDITHIKYYQF